MHNLCLNVLAFLFSVVYYIQGCTSSHKGIQISTSINMHFYVQPKVCSWENLPNKAGIISSIYLAFVTRLHQVINEQSAQQYKKAISKMENMQREAWLVTMWTRIYFFQNVFFFSDFFSEFYFLHFYNVVWGENSFFFCSLIFQDFCSKIFV